MISSQFLSPAGREVRLVNAEVKQILNFPNPSQQQKISTLNFAKSKSTCLIPEIVQMAFLSGLPNKSMQAEAGAERGWNFSNLLQILKINQKTFYY